MYIIRNNRRIDLTPNELERAYREQKRNYLLEDAKKQFYVYIGWEDACNKCDDENLKIAEEFVQLYGFTHDQAVNKASDHYLLDEIAKEYEHLHDCNEEENTTWQIAVDHVLTMVANHKI